MFLFFFKIFIYYILGKFYFAHFTPICSFSFFKIFPPLWGIYISRTLPFSRTLVRFEKERLFLYRTKVFILYHAKVHNYSRPAYPYFACKNMANYFIAGEVPATISSNNLPFHTPYITPIVTT